MAGVGEVVTALPSDAIVELPGTATRPSESSTAENDRLHADHASDTYQQQLPTISILYVLNNHRNPQWCYSYESGLTKAQGEKKHVLAAYVLRLHPSGHDVG